MKYGLENPGKGKPYGPYRLLGRGYVQLTWQQNCDKAGTELNADLVRHPELALQSDIAAQVMFRSMTDV